ncbi:helix-turn-helix domain-containing protein [Streptosporangium sp. CA-115845]|uniref:helix-turn-helix domain-containing protein n=1 Tax=Streptosporangium sp. CA-115845 TaxID=3240071 RepID=UPI003D926E16
MDAPSRPRGRPRRGQAAADLLPADGPVMTAAHVAALLGVSDRTVRRDAHAQTIHGLLLAPRVWRFGRACLLARLRGTNCADIVYDDEILTIEQAAALLGIAPATLLAAAGGAVIPSVRVGGQWRFSRAALLHALCPQHLPSSPAPSSLAASPDDPPPPPR